MPSNRQRIVVVTPEIQDLLKSASASLTVAVCACGFGTVTMRDAMRVNEAVDELELAIARARELSKGWRGEIDPDGSRWLRQYKKKG